MKYVCERCSRLVDVGHFEVREGELVLSCPTCGGESVGAPGSARHAPVLEFAPPRPVSAGPRCPKCGAPRLEQVESCGRCGLVFALYRPENLALPPEAEARWAAVEASWNEVARHEAFLAACSGPELLTEAARRYRLRAEQSPQDAIAVRYRDELVAQLVAIGTAQLRETPAVKPKQRGVLVLILVLVLLGAMLGLLRMVQTMPLPGDY